MAKKQALVDRDIQPAGRLRENVNHVLDVEISGVNREEELVTALTRKEAVFATSRLKLTEQVLEESNLELIAKLGTGIDNVDLTAATRLDIPVIYTPGLNAMSVAEHTVGLLLAVAHRIGQTQDLLRAGGWRNQASLGIQLYGKTVGIVGFGNIGRRVATLLSGFNPRILAYDPYVREIEGEVTGAELTSLERVLNESDAVCVNAELNGETRKMIDQNALEQMKSSAVLVNTARGALVDTNALVAVLRQNDLAGAGLDVYEEEPLSSESELHDLDNVVTTPHVGAMTIDYRTRGIDILSKNSLAILKGESIEEDYIAVSGNKD